MKKFSSSLKKTELRITYTKKILRGLHYLTLHKLIDRRIEICSVETIESDLFAILGGNLPSDSKLILPEKIFLEGALAKYGLIDAKLSVSNRHLDSCPLINGDMLRELGFALSKEDKETLTKKANNDEDIGLLDTLAEEVDKNEAIIKLFLRTEDKHNRIFPAKLPNDFFPRTFVVEDACLTNSDYVWFNKHFYL